MATQLQIRRGTSSQVAAFTGAEGEVVVNTTNDSIHVNDGSTAGGFELARVDGSNWAITNNISTTANISFGDNDKAIFGAGSDLEIFHDGSHSYVRDSGTGHLKLQGTDVRIQSADGAENFLVADLDGAVKLYNNDAQKFQTTSTGIDVTGNATFADNGKAIFGAGSDLQIYHDGSASYIQDTGTGALYLQGDGGVNIRNAAGTENKAVFASDGAVTLYHDNAQVFSTTSSGIDTGTVTADGLTLGSEGDQISIPTSAGFSGIITTGDSISGNAFEFKNGNGIAIVSDTNDSAVTGGVDATLIARGSSATKTALFDANGDVSLFEDTGTTAKFYWDSSAESLGIGTSSPAGPLNVHSASGDTNLYLTTGNTAASTNIFFGDSGNSNIGRIVYDHNGDYMKFRTNGQDAMRIDSSGNLIVGGTTAQGASAVTLTAGGSIVTDGFVKPHTDASYDLGASSQRWQDLYLSGDVYATNIKGQNDANTKIEFLGSDVTRFVQGGSEKARLDASGNLLVGKTSTGIATVGTQIESAGGVHSTAASERAFIGNRTTTDGSIIELRKDNATVGSIGTNGGDLFVGTGDTNILFADGSDKIMPATTGGATRDAAIDLGTTGGRFKDLYLSGNVNAAQVNLADAGGTLRNVLDLDGSDNLKVSTGASAGTRAITLFTENAERMRLDASGNILFHKTITAASTAGAVFVPNNYLSVSNTQTGSTARLLLLNRHSGTGTAVEFRQANAGVGSISLTASATAYNTTSDQRLKDNIVDAPSASDDIDAIQVRSFDWKADGSHQKYGMVAQELQSVAPEAVSGDADSDEMMGVDYSKLVPMLVKEIQSLRNRVAQLENN